MTPKELKERADRVKKLQDQLETINDPKSYIVITEDTDKVFIRRSHGSFVYIEGNLKKLAQFIFTTIKNKSILDIEQEIKELCNDN